ncbi:hypothetical protein BACCAP_00682 [Pseudoflavonifractor capillosus ATCC 29799]|uniref:Uncharacterized protein n=1 Tax=Pseudoflavonifractor capillosus ATCC 29799 TaxID=411467 RepID=A6NR57_9FIRM|nr:hypothetical protein BACCAP_00682 [Pseudoflavonifractor capillosus ATCC 29799]
MPGRMIQFFTKRLTAPGTAERKISVSKTVVRSGTRDILKG